MYILITGVAGLLGSNLAKWVLKNKKEYSVVGIDNLSGGYFENIPDNVIFHNIDLKDSDKLIEIFRKYNIEIVYHFAAYAAEGLSPFIRKFNYENNVISSINLINCAINFNITRFVFTSSAATYGFGNHCLPFHEDNTQLVPIDPYGIAKMCVEYDLKVAQTQHDLEYCIIVPHNIYGEQQNIWDKYRNVLGIWCNQLLNNKPITIYGDGNQERAFSYVGDILEPLWNAGFSESSKNQRINLGGIQSYSINEAANMLIHIAGYGDIEYLEKRHEVKHSYTTYKKSEDLLGFKHKTQLKNGLTQLWNWSKEQPNRDIMVWDNYEIDKKIYSYWKVN